MWFVLVPLGLKYLFTLCAKGLGLTMLLILSYDAAADSTNEGVPEIQPFMFPLRLSEGSKAKVLCHVVHGKRPVEFSWLKNGHRLTKNSEDFQISVQDDFSMLTIGNIKAENAGTYTCVVKNSAGTSNHSANLIVEAPPTWIMEPSDTTGVYGSSMTLDCAAAGLPTPQITWYKGGDVIRGDSGRMVARGNGTLRIHILNEEDEGLYRCTAHNGVGETLFREIKILVNGINMWSPFIFYGSNIIFVINESCYCSNCVKCLLFY